MEDSQQDSTEHSKQKSIQLTCQQQGSIEHNKARTASTFLEIQLPTCFNLSDEGSVPHLLDFSPGFLIITM